MFEQTNQIAQLEDIMIRNKLFEKFCLSRIGVFGKVNAK